MKFTFAAIIIICLAGLATFAYINPTNKVREKSPDEFIVWSVSDSHVSKDWAKGKRESLAIAIKQSQGEVDGYTGFNWDVMIDAGDFAGNQFPPEDEEGAIVVSQYKALKKHLREDVYQVAGNHDGDYYDRASNGQYWFDRWVDPLGQNPSFSGVDNSKRKYPVTGDNEKYSFQAGNILFLMLHDYNTAPFPVGRGTVNENRKGGIPAGAVTRETFEWWKSQVLNNQDKIIITVHHYVLRDTTTRSKHGGGAGLHGVVGGGKNNGEGTGYLYYIVEDTNPETFRYTEDATDFNDFLNEFYAANGKPAIDLWIGGHSHAENPYQTKDGQGLVEQRHGVTFLQTSGLTFWHAGGVPLSRILTFVSGGNTLTIETYLHGTEQGYGKDKGSKWPHGFFDETKVSIPLRHNFKMPETSSQ